LNSEDSLKEQCNELSNFIIIEDKNEWKVKNCHDELTHRD